MKHLGRILFLCLCLIWAVSAWGQENRDPVVGPLELKLSINETGTINILSAASDPDKGDVVVFASLFNGKPGITVSDPVKNIVTVTTTEQTGIWDVEYIVRDRRGKTASNILRVIVEKPDNQNPITVQDRHKLKAGETKNIDVLANDSDPDEGDLVTLIRFVNPPPELSVQINDDGRQTIKAGDKEGTYRIQYRVQDKRGAKATGDLFVTIETPPPPKNNPPQPKNDSIEVFVGEPSILYPLRNDTDLDEDDVRVVKVMDPPEILQVKLLSSRSVRIQSSKAGIFNFGYEVSDGQDISAATVTVQVRERPPENQPPEAVKDNYTVRVGETKTIHPLGNDVDPDGHEIRLKSVDFVPEELKVTELRGGLLSVDGFCPEGVYTINYTIEDIPAGASSSGVITINLVDPSEDINEPPIANADSYSVVAGKSLVIFPQNNDKDPEGLPLSLAMPSVHSAGINVEMTIGQSYRVTAQETPGTYEFEYTVIDQSGLADSSTVSINVLPQSDDVESCRRTGRLNEYLINLDGLSKGLTASFEAANPKIFELPDQDLWPEMDRLRAKINEAPTCSQEVKERAVDIDIRLAQLKAATSGVRPLEELRAEWLQINDEAVLSLPRVKKLRESIPSCVPRSDYKSFDNALGAELEAVYDLDLRRQALLKDLDHYQPENWEYVSFDEVAAEIDDLYTEIADCPAEANPAISADAFNVVDNSYSIRPGQIKILDPLANDTGKGLKIVDVHPAPGVLISPASYLVEPPFSVALRSDQKLELMAGYMQGQYDFTITVQDELERSKDSVITLNITENGSLPNWLWPLIGGTLIGGGLLGFMLKGRMAGGAVLEPSAAAKALKYTRRLLRKDLKFRKDDGVPFGKSPLIASVTEPGPPPKEPAGHNIPVGLATISGPYAVLMEAYRATGRIGFAQEGVPTNDDVSLGTGFLIGRNLVMTNQHVYEAYKHYLEGDECGGIEFIAERDRDASDYYAFDGRPPIILPELDIAIFRTAEKVKNRHPIKRVHIPTDDLAEREVIVVGYPCPFEVDDYILSLVEPDPIFAVKRVTQGQVFRHSSDKDGPFGILFKVDALINGQEQMSAVCHNATTLAGNSGSPVICAKTGKLLGVHFAGSRSLFGGEAANLAMAIESILEKEEEEEF